MVSVASAAAANYAFEDPAWDLDFVRAGNADQDANYSEIMGSGACVFDYDNDGWEDLFLGNGRFADDALQASISPTSMLYHNDAGNGLTAVPGAIETRAWGMGCAAGDYDNDGDKDLAYSTYGMGTYLFRNDGGGTFTNVTAGSGVATSDCGAMPCFGASIAWLDYDLDGDLDLFLTNYVDWDGVSPAAPNLQPGQCNALYRNDGDGTFTDVTEESATADCEWNHLGLAIGDYDNDGYQDVYIASDESPNTLLMNNRDGTFSSLGNESGVDDARGGMGVATGDYDNDGLLDIVITHFETEGFALYQREAGDLKWHDRMAPAGMNRTRDFVGWGTEFIDLDRDGWLDVVYVNGHVNVTYTSDSPGEQKGIHPYQQDTLIYLNQKDGTFVDVTNDSWFPAQKLGVGRGLAFGDFDADGYPDPVIVNNANESAYVWRSARGPNNWLTLRLDGGTATGVNPDALGALVDVVVDGTSVRREVVAAGSYLSQSTRDVSLGLASALSADFVNVTWPDGSTQSFSDVTANQVLTLTYGGALQSLHARPVATAAAALSTFIDEPVVLTGAVAESGAGGTTVSWTVDGVTTAGSTLEWTPTRSGVFEAAFRVTDSSGYWDEAVTTVTVEGHPPVAVIDAPTSAVRGALVTLDGSSSSSLYGPLSAYAWSVEEADLDTAVATHRFAGVHDVEVTLTVTDFEGRTDTATTVVHVLAPPVANATGPALGDRLTPAVFAAGSSTDEDGVIASWTWAFGDEATASCSPESCTHYPAGGGQTTTAGPLAPHVFAGLGEHVVTLRVTDDEGLEHATSMTITIVNLLPVAGIDGPALVNVNRPLSWDPTGSADPDGALTYEWSTGGTTFATTAQGTHAFASPGNHVIWLIVRDADGAAAVANFTVTAVTDLAVVVTMDDDEYGPLDEPSGTVTAHFVDGTPAPGADVTVIVRYHPVYKEYPWLLDRPQQHAEIQGVTGADGAFRFTVPSWTADTALDDAPVDTGPLHAPTLLIAPGDPRGLGTERVTASATWSGNAGADETTYHVVATRLGEPPMLP